MDFAAVVLRLSLVMMGVPAGFSIDIFQNHICEANTTCRSLIGYAPVNRTTFGAIQSLFNVNDLTDILGVNGFPESTRPNDPVEASTTIRILIECKCDGQRGVSNQGPIYTIKKGDTFYLVAKNTFNGLTAYEYIQSYNPQAIATNLSIGEEVYIPLPCFKKPTEFIWLPKSYVRIIIFGEVGVR